MRHSLSDVVRRVDRTLRPHKAMRRRVHGVELEMPRAHRLPDYVSRYPAYGLNLVHLAEVLGKGAAPVKVVDVGANIGDSALQILHVTDARVLCVEGDQYWVDYLQRNVAADPRVSVEPSLLSYDPVASYSPVRAAGTTRFEQGPSVETAASLTATELRVKHMDKFDDVDLIKSDTDGYDTRLVPALARAWQESRPTLFLEFDPALSLAAGDPDPASVWSELAALGYGMASVWDNLGGLLGESTTEDLALGGERLAHDIASGKYHYWDVAVAHNDSQQGQAAIRALCEGRRWEARD